MKFRYNDTDKVLISYGSDCGPEQIGFTTEDTELPNPNENLAFYKRTSLGVFERRPQSEIDAIQAINDFRFKRFWGYVFRNLSSDAIYALCGFEQPIESLWYHQNIAGIRPFIQGLVGKVLEPGSYTVTQVDIDVVIAGFAEQGVILP